MELILAVIPVLLVPLVVLIHVLVQFLIWVRVGGVGVGVIIVVVVRRLERLPCVQIRVRLEHR